MQAGRFQEAEELAGAVLACAAGDDDTEATAFLLSIIECEPRLERLFARSFPRAHVMGTKFQQHSGLPPDAPPVAFRIPAGSLPALFRNALGDFPVHEGYLSADPEKVEQWRARFRSLGAGPKIGIAWTGEASKRCVRFARFP